MQVTHGWGLRLSYAFYIEISYWLKHVSVVIEKTYWSEIFRYNWKLAQNTPPFLTSKWSVFVWLVRGNLFSFIPLDQENNIIKAICSCLVNRVDQFWVSIVVMVGMKNTTNWLTNLTSKIWWVSFSVYYKLISS